jgi:hypothetical protein
VLRSPIAAAWVAVGSLFAYRISTTVVDLDLFHQMALVREWRALGAFPRVDLYAFTPTVAPFLHHEWGAGAIAYVVAMSLGGPGILLLRYGLGFALAIVAVRTALRIGATPVVVAILAPIAILLVENGYPPVRAHAYSFLLAAISLHLFERDRTGERRWLWWLVPLFGVWVNLHAGFVFGIALVMAYMAERAVIQRGQILHVGLVVIAIAAAVAVNPYGVEYYSHVLRALRVDRGLISEWDPLWAAVVPLQQKIAFGTAVGLVGYALAFGRGAGRKGLLILAATAFAGALHHRLLPFFGTAWLVYCPALLEGTLLTEQCRRVARRPQALLGASTVLTVAACALIWISKPLTLEIPNDPRGGLAGSIPYYPVGAVEFLQTQRFAGNLLTPFDQGSYVLWKLYPRVKVSLDSRYEAAYEPALVEELLRLYRTGDGLPAVLEKYRPDALLVPRHSGLARAAIPFGKVYEDASFALYARPESGLKPAASGVPARAVFP